MQVTFRQDYLKELYEKGTVSDKKHRFQPAIIKKYGRVVNLMIAEKNVLGLAKYGAMHYERLQGDKQGLSSVRVNDQYRIEFEEFIKDGETIASICEITELSNHYK
jgi:proteic killer suppression protein